MKENLQNHIIIGTTLLLTAGALIFGTWFVHYNQNEFESVVRMQLSDEQAALEALAEITDRNGADAVIEATISDCARRDEYEALLGSLSTLSAKELLTLQNLSDSCGSFYAERKALMVGKLERELVVYTNLITLLSVLTSHDLESYKLAEWNEIITLERTRSTLLTDQKNIQEKIISALIIGEYINGKTVSTLVRDAGEINELLMVSDRNIDEKRELLIK